MNQDILNIIELFENKHLFEKALRNKDSSLLLRLLRNRYEGDIEERLVERVCLLIDKAAFLGYLEGVKIIDEFSRYEKVVCTKQAMDWAARFGYLEIVKFLHENRTEGCTVDAMDYAAQHGHFEVVKFLDASISNA